jgi:protein gp37
MGKTTGIAWTDHTFNPWWGCIKVSAGCTNCYAEHDSKRWDMDIWGPGRPRRFFGDKHWNEPLTWNRAAEHDGVRRRVFCGSMCDVFEDRKDLIEHRLRLYRLIGQTQALDWLLLTKRPENVMGFVPEFYKPGFYTHGGWPANVWIGTTAENQEWADQRIPELIKIPARVRFLSCEPLLGPIDLSGQTVSQVWINDIGDFDNVECGISWVIVGGESGPHARPMHPAWARSLRFQCQAAEVPFFFKQWGEWLSDSQIIKYDPRHWPRFATARFGTLDIDGTWSPDVYPARFPTEQQQECMYNLGKKNAGDLLDGKEWHQFPELL